MTQADKMDRLDVRQKNGRISKSDYTTGNPDSINVIRTVENYKKGWRKSFFLMGSCNQSFVYPRGIF